MWDWLTNHVPFAKSRQPSEVPVSKCGKRLRGGVAKLAVEITMEKKRSRYLEWRCWFFYRVLLKIQINGFHTASYLNGFGCVALSSLRISWYSSLFCTRSFAINLVSTQQQYSFIFELKRIKMPSGSCYCGQAKISYEGDAIRQVCCYHPHTKYIYSKKLTVSTNI